MRGGRVYPLILISKPGVVTRPAAVVAVVIAQVAASGSPARGSMPARRRRAWPQPCVVAAWVACAASAKHAGVPSQSGAY